MSAFGEIYVEVAADVVNSGIMALDASGETGSGEGGTTGASWWLLWQYNIEADNTVTGGYSGFGWFWGAQDNYLTTAWVASGYAATYGSGEDGFKKYLAEVQPPNLDEFLGAWPKESKADFVNHTIMGTSYSSCVELRA